MELTETALESTIFWCECGHTTQPKIVKCGAKEVPKKGVEEMKSGKLGVFYWKGSSFRSFDEMTAYIKRWSKEKISNQSIEEEFARLKTSFFSNVWLDSDTIKNEQLCRWMDELTAEMLGKIQSYREAQKEKKLDEN